MTVAVQFGYMGDNIFWNENFEKMLLRKRIKTRRSTLSTNK